MSSPALTDTLRLPPLRQYPQALDSNPDWLERAWFAGSAPCVAALSGLRVRRLRQIVRPVERLAKRTTKLSDAELQQDAVALRIDLCRHAFDPLPVARAFALVREASRRTFGYAHNRSQIMGGYAMLNGMIAEMQTGEGKTLCATLPASTAALAGIQVHLVTVNDYLAKRDAEWMGEIYSQLGISVGVVQEGMSPDERREAYFADVTYCTNKELALDYLRDQLILGERTDNLHLKLDRVIGSEGRVARTTVGGLEFAIVDEADSVLIDEARTPLIISGQDQEAKDDEAAVQALTLAEGLTPGSDYLIRPDGPRIELTAGGKLRAKAIATEWGGSWTVGVLREELAVQALTATRLFHRDQHYLVRDGKVVIVDEYTGRVSPDRFWSDGLHQLIEIKEGCEPSPRNCTLGRLTYQRFFRRYRRLAGMTGTAREVGPELWSVYRLPVATIPTAAWNRRRTWPDRVVRRRRRKLSLIARRAARLQRQGRPVLIGTRTVGASEELSRVLIEHGLPHSVLNAAQNEDEALIVAEAGQPGRITIVTNMAGRGTDIALGPGVARAGGLTVILSERHAAARIDRQLAGRCARQGDPGRVEVILSLEDELLQNARSTTTGRLLQALAWISPPLAGRLAIGHAQATAERLHARARRDLLRYDRNMGTALAFSGSME